MRYILVLMTLLLASCKTVTVSAVTRDDYINLSKDVSDIAAHLQETNKNVQKIADGQSVIIDSILQPEITPEQKDKLNESKKSADEIVGGVDKNNESIDKIKHSIEYRDQVIQNTVEKKETELTGLGGISLTLIIGAVIFLGLFIFKFVRKTALPV